MRVIQARTVNEALATGLHHLRVQGVKQESRVGDVIASPYPVMTVYRNPTNRVLFSPMRDANPFFHVMEALWMLAGRNDLPWLTRFNSRFASYSDDGGLTQPGAYGHRWRSFFGYDQLETLIVELNANPQTRRGVLTMWDGGQCYEISENAEPASDLLRAIGGSADVPCNTHAYFDTITGKLNMTVCCRSNDIIWGAYGANAVHFSFLLEYICAMTGLPMGEYRQFSNNFHIYTNIVPEEAMMAYARDSEHHDRYLMREGSFVNMVPRDPDLRRIPLVDDTETFLAELDDFMHDRPTDYNNRFLGQVAVPMHAAYMCFKEKNYDGALDMMEKVRAEDWRTAGVEWLQRRKIKAEINRKPFTEVTENGAA